MIKGNHHTEESKRKIANSYRGRSNLGGHLTEEHKQKISLARKGMLFTEEHKANIGKASKKAWTKERKLQWSILKKGKPLSKEHKRKISESLKGKLKGRKLSEEHKRKIGLKSKGRIPSKETRIKIGLKSKGRRLSDETKRKLSLAHKGKSTWIKGKHHTEETKKKISIANKGRPSWAKGRHHSEEAKQKISEKITIISRKRWEDPLWHAQQLRKMHSGGKQGKTRPEKKLEHLLKKLFLGEYAYVGNGKKWIGHRNPDFININGQRKVIELFGNYWHGKSVTGISNTKHRKARQEHFVEYGYKCCVVWEHELKNKKKITAKLKKFHSIERACELRRKRRYD